jgi:putative tryptophan/tyrosine transport system permease protein
MLLNFPTILSIIFGSLGGGFLALMTAHIHLRLKINSLLAGIIVSTMAYSISLRILGKPNVSLFFQPVLALNSVSLSLIVMGLALLFFLFLKTDFGLRFRSVGHCHRFCQNQGVQFKRYIYLGLLIAGMFYGLAGGMLVQMQQYMDLGMGVGIVIHGLASLMIGEAIVGRENLLRQLNAPIVGALIYQQIQGVALAIGLLPSDLKFFTGCILLLVLFIQNQESCHENL